MLPHENTSLLGLRTTQEHRLALTYTRDMISQSPRFFLLITMTRACGSSGAKSWAATREPKSSRSRSQPHPPPPTRLPCGPRSGGCRSDRALPKHAKSSRVRHWASCIVQRWTASSCDRLLPIPADAMAYRRHQSLHSIRFLCIQCNW